MLFSLLVAGAAAAQQPSHQAPRQPAQPPLKSMIDDPDLRCMVAISYALSIIEEGKTQADEEERSGVVALVMYYVGKIDGRMPGFDYAKEVTSLIQSPGYEQNGLASDLDRCGKEATERGRTLQELSKQLQDLAPLLQGGRAG